MCLCVFLLSLKNADAYSRIQSVIFVVRFINEKKVDLFRYTEFFHRPIWLSLNYTIFSAEAFNEFFDLTRGRFVNVAPW